VWGRKVNGVILTFHLAGLNNQNFIMRDDETGTYWQQISGMAIAGPLAGQQLQLVHADELTFATWKAEEPDGTVLRDDPSAVAHYSRKNWEVKAKDAPVVLRFDEHGLAPRDLMIGVSSFGSARAYLYDDVLRDKLIEDRMGGKRILVVAAADGKSVRAFRIPDEDLSFFLLNENGASMMDSGGSHWDFRGCAADGKAKGECLEKLDAMKDYWFNWRNYNPGTTVYRH
jgi:hypothetical protein